MVSGGFSDKLSLKEKAEEDLWFARHDRELVERLHKHKSEDAAGNTMEDKQPPPPDDTPPGA